MWANLASSQGLESSRKYRDTIAKEMTSSQIEKAQRLARECLERDYKDC